MRIKKYSVFGIRLSVFGYRLSGLVKMEMVGK
jgi:hypothetical protein